MGHISLNAQERSEFGDGPARRLRRQGLVPGVVYQPGGPSLALSLPDRDLRRALAEGRTAVIDLSIEGVAGAPGAPEGLAPRPGAGQRPARRLPGGRPHGRGGGPGGLGARGRPRRRAGGRGARPDRSRGRRARPAGRRCRTISRSTSAGWTSDRPSSVADITAPPGVTIVTEPEIVVASVVAPSVEVEPEPEEVEEGEELLEGEEPAEPEDDDSSTTSRPRSPWRATRPRPRSVWWPGSGTRSRATRARATTPARWWSTRWRRGSARPGSPAATAAAWPRRAGRPDRWGCWCPLTYMNESGHSVGPAAGALHAAPEQVLVVHDEIDLPFGTVRGKIGGGAGGHNGLRSVTRGLGTGEFPRLRLGVGKPDPEFRGDGADWVLDPLLGAARGGGGDDRPRRRHGGGRARRGHGRGHEPVPRRGRRMRAAPQ